MSQPELGGNQIVRFVTKQAPAPQALKFGGGAQEGEEGGEARGVYGVQNCDCEVVGSHLGLQAAPKAAISMGVHWHARRMRRRP